MRPFGALCFVQRSPFFSCVSFHAFCAVLCLHLCHSRAVCLSSVLCLYPSVYCTRVSLYSRRQGTIAKRVEWGREKCEWVRRVQGTYYEGGLRYVSLAFMEERKAESEDRRPPPFITGSALHSPPASSRGSETSSGVWETQKAQSTIAPHLSSLARIDRLHYSLAFTYYYRLSSETQRREFWRYLRKNGAIPRVTRLYSFLGLLRHQNDTTAPLATVLLVFIFIFLHVSLPAIAAL